MPTHSGRIHRLNSAVLLTIYLFGCTRWKQPDIAPDQVLAKRPQLVRVTRPDSTVLQLRHPWIAGDSLYGRAGADTTGLPLTDVAKLEIRATNVVGTVILVGGVTLLLAASLATMGDGYLDTSEPVASCPLVYSWDGSKWRLDSGTFGGAIMPALARTEVDNLLFVRPDRDTLRLRVANELRETDHLDQIAVLAVDHSPTHTVAPDALGRLHTVGRLVSPLATREFRGGNAQERVRADDGWAWESNPSGRDTSRPEDARDGLELTFRRPAGAMRAQLVVDASNTVWAELMMWRFVSLHGTATQAWYDSVARDPRLARRLGDMMEREVYLGVSVLTGRGWERQGLVREAGPEIMKRQVVALDLSRVSGDVVRIRLESAPSLWRVDQVAMDFSPPGELTVIPLTAARAETPDGRDLRAAIVAPDRSEHVMEQGDRLDLVFAVPPTRAGRDRSYLLVTRGWYRLHAPATGEPAIALLDRVLTEPLAASRFITGELVRSVAALQDP